MEGHSAVSSCHAHAACHRSDIIHAMASDRAIQTEKLMREFKKGPRAVDGIDLYVDHGEIYGFLGPNGAGKSTTVLMLTTLLPPTSGRAWVAGHDVAKDGPSARAAIGGRSPGSRPRSSAHRARASQAPVGAPRTLPLRAEAAIRRAPESSGAHRGR